jgi:hypothetical protein
VGTLFSHHQKCVILDTQSSGNNRKITSFIGGLDLCNGRYDTPEHRLFRGLDTVFENDFHCPTFPVSFCYTYPCTDDICSYCISAFLINHFFNSATQMCDFSMIHLDSPFEEHCFYISQNICMTSCSS